MSALMRPALFPEEFHWGYLGRVLRLNGYGSAKHTLEAMHDCFGGRNGTHLKRTSLELLSLTSGLRVETFTQSHTMVPLRCAIETGPPRAPHGSRANTYSWKFTTCLLERKNAYFCVDCMTEDLDFHGQSYWRRVHQIPGQLWCPKHRTPLHVANDRHLFTSSPQCVLDASTQVPIDWIAEAKGNENMERFFAIASELLDETMSFELAHVASIIKKAVGRQGFRTHGTYRSGPSEFLSDRIFLAFPRRWLGEVSRSWSKKVEGQFFWFVDTACNRKTGQCSVPLYLLMLAYLFPNADTTLMALREARDSSQRQMPLQREMAVPDVLRFSALG